ncbi:Holliday junction branch migration protein RuvA [Vallitalea okinawensis]|uniref:Holliday junction branch migration protein RuvA n=1 Tax=Vallitalea okinawensis TaxID=2078660 RepID=UPI000CFBCCE3|nr:Holliday junction branch migration protein RuvA [Vallitalea okinawensis]
MITYINGTLMTVGEDHIVIDVNQIGYSIQVASSTIFNLPNIGQKVLVYTYLQIKEDGAHLYGFLTNEELELFKKLITVNGIGPKGGLAILSTITPSDLYVAIVTEDIKAISKAPGVGKKTAGRIILDLKDKIKTEELLFSPSKVGENMTIGEPNYDSNEAISALTALGYSKAEAVKAVTLVGQKDHVEEVIKEALKKLASI